MGEIATAFVRIRPNMAGFRSETQAGVKGAFLGIGKIFAAAIGVDIGAHIVHSAIESAASIQKQLEVVRFEFGRAGEGLIKFADTAGIALGDSNRSTDEASARFGLLFKSLGIGQKQAAGMTLGFEKLALSVNAIRGGGAQGAETLLKQIVLAAAGNTRGLKQMGIVVDATSEKIAAFKLGLISNMTQALTPAQKTEAIYAIATAHLGQTMALAKKHSGDLANVQARLSAEFMLAKERLGNALLPYLARFVGFLADKLPGAMDVLFGVLRAFKTEAVAAFNVIKPVFEPIVNVFRHVIDAFKGSGGIVGGLKRLRTEFSRLSPAAKIAVAALGGIAAAFAAIVVTSFPITSIVLLGLALAEAYRRSETFRNAVARISAFFQNTIIPAFHGAVAAVNRFFRSAPVTSTLQLALQKLIGVAKDAWATFKKVFHGIEQVVRVAVGIILVIWHHFGHTIVASIKASLTIVAGVFHGAMEVIRGLLDLFAGIFTGDWHKLWKGLKEIMGGFLHASVTALRAWGGVVKAFFVDLWHTIEKIVLEGIEKVVHLLAKIPTGFTVFGHHFGFTNPFIGWDSTLKTTIANVGKVKQQASQLPHAINGAIGRGLNKGPLIKTLLPAHAKAQLASLNAGLADLTKKFAAANPAIRRSADAKIEAIRRVEAALIASFRKGQITYAQFENRLSQIQTGAFAKLKTLGQSIGDQVAKGTVNGITGSAPAIQKTLSDTMQRAVAAANRAIQNSVQSAKNNLDKIGQDLAKTITDIQTKLGGAAGALAGSPQGKAFQQLKKLIESGAPAFEIARARARLDSQLQNVGKQNPAGQIGTQLANLTAQFNKGTITYRQFEARLHRILRQDGLNMAQALKKVGPALADQLRAEIKAIQQQAKAINDVPKKFRGIGGAGGAADIKIIRPLQVIRAEQAHIAVIAQKQRAAQLKATQTTNQILRNFKQVHIGPLPGHGKTPHGKGSHNARAHAKTGGRG